MKLLGVISTSALLLLLGAAVPAYAQEEHHEQEAKPEKQEQKAKPEKQEQKAQPEKQEQKAQPAKQQEPAKTAKQEEPAKTEKQAQAGKQEPENKNVKQEEARKPAAQQQQQHVQHSAAEEKRQRSEPALRLSVRGSGRIPEERFHANFGREHNFRIGAPVLVGGYSRFQYSGFWFGFVEPWPVAWYYTDDVYVDYIDGGYYLINPSYPEARISISVVI